MLDYSSEAILAGAKLRTLAPANQFTLEDSEYLSLIDDELQSTITSLLMSLRQNYLLKNSLYTIQVGDVLGFGDDNFGLLPFGSPIPISTQDLLERAVGTIVKDIWYVDTNGKILGQVAHLSNADMINLNTNAVGFYFESSKIVFHPADQFNNKNIKILYFRKPNKLVPSEQCAKIIFSNFANSTIQVDAVPAGWAIGTKLDIIRGKQAFDSVLDSVTIGGISGTEIQLSAIVDNLNAGDFVVPEGCACVAQIPVFAYPILMQAGAVKILESMKDKAGKDSAEAAYNKLVAGLTGVGSNRAQSNLKNIIGYGIWR